MCELHRRRPNARSGGMNQDALAPLQPGSGKECVVRRDECLRHCGGLRPVKLRRNAREVAFRYDDKFRLAAAGRDPEDAVAHFPTVG